VSDKETKVTVRTVDIQHALFTDPFEGDETDVTPLSDNEEGKIMTFRFCNKCTRAQAHPDGTGRLLDSRFTIGHKRRLAESVSAQ
jgi:hypothetical protein